MTKAMSLSAAKKEQEELVQLILKLQQRRMARFCRLDGSFYLVSKCSGKCLDVADRSIRPGGRIHQWINKLADNQKWVLEPVSTSACLYVLKAQHSSLVMDVCQGSLEDGKSIVQWTAEEGKATQQWAFDAIPGTSLFKITNCYSGKSLDVRGGGDKSGAQLQQATYKAEANQKWQLQPALPLSSGLYRITSRRSQKCVSLCEEGTSLLQAVSKMSMSQIWIIEPTGKESQGADQHSCETFYTIMSTLNFQPLPGGDDWLIIPATDGYFHLQSGGVALEVIGGSQHDHGSIVPAPSSGRDNQLWFLERLQLLPPDNCDSLASHRAISRSVTSPHGSAQISDDFLGLAAARQASISLMQKSGIDQLQILTSPVTGSGRSTPTTPEQRPGRASSSLPSFLQPFMGTEDGSDTYYSSSSRPSSPRGQTQQSQIPSITTTTSFMTYLPQRLRSPSSTTAATTERSGSSETSENIPTSVSRGLSLQLSSMVFQTNPTLSSLPSPSGGKGEAIFTRPSMIFTSGPSVDVYNSTTKARSPFAGLGVFSSPTLEETSVVVASDLPPMSHQGITAL